MKFIEAVAGAMVQVPESGWTVTHWRDILGIELRLITPTQTWLLCGFDRSQEPFASARLTDNQIQILMEYIVSSVCRQLVGSAEIIPNRWHALVGRALRAYRSQPDSHFGEVVREVIVTDAADWSTDYVWGQGNAVRRSDIKRYSVVPVTGTSHYRLLAVAHQETLVLFEGTADDCYAAWRYVASKRVGTAFTNQIRDHVRLNRNRREAENRQPVPNTPPSRQIVIDGTEE